MEVNMRRCILGAILFVMASLVAFGQTASPSDAGQDHRKLQQLDRDAHQDKQAALNDRNDVKQDQADLRTAVKDGNKTEANKDRKELSQDKRDLSKDKRDLVRDRRLARQIRKNTPSVGPRGGRR
jgi:hypothetical protein